MDCVYVYTVVASRRVQALLRNLLWAEHEDKYTNPVDRKETVRHVQPGFDSQQLLEDEADPSFAPCVGEFAYFSIP